MLETHSPMNVSNISKKFRASIPMRAGNIATPLGSTISRAKLDYTGYDPDAFRKKRVENPVRDIVQKKDNEDDEVFTTDIAGEATDFGNFEAINAQGSSAEL